MIYIESKSIVIQSSLSGGQKAKGSKFASVLCKKSKLMFFDEPTSGMDYCNMMKYIPSAQTNVKAIRKIIFIVSHDQEFLNSIADNIIYL